jgi:hypothetical protein
MVVAGIKMVATDGRKPGAVVWRVYVPDASETGNANAPVALATVVIALPDVSTSRRAADGMGVVVPACTTCPVSPNVVAGVEGVDGVDGDVGESVDEPQLAETHATARQRKSVRIDIMSGHNLANLPCRCKWRTAADFL